MRYLLDVHIRGFGFLGVYNAQIVYLLNLAVIALDLVGVKNDNHLTFAEAHIVAQRVNQRLPCAVDVVLGKLFEVFPREYYVVSVNKDVLVAVEVLGAFLLFILFRSL